MSKNPGGRGRIVLALLIRNLVSINARVLKEHLGMTCAYYRMHREP